MIMIKAVAGISFMMHIKVIDNDYDKSCGWNIIHDAYQGD